MNAILAAKIAKKIINMNNNMFKIVCTGNTANILHVFNDKFIHYFSRMKNYVFLNSLN